MADYQCPKCGVIYRHAPVGNLNCADLKCNNTPLLPASKTLVSQRTEPYKRWSIANSKYTVKIKTQTTRRKTLRTYDGKLGTPITSKSKNYDDDKDLDKAEYENADDKLETCRQLALVSDDELEREVDDTDFVPTDKRWEFDHRLTAADMAERKIFPINLSVIKKAKLSPVATAIDGERQKDCGVIIGFALKVQRISAWAVSNRINAAIGRKWRSGEKDTAEWCHLVGVSLGGKTVAENLVAASYCANTYMGVIEKTLQGRTDLEVEIAVEGQPSGMLGAKEYDHVAEKILYVISTCGSAMLITFTIDARISSFSKSDAGKVAQLLKTALPAFK